MFLLLYSHCTNAILTGMEFSGIPRPRNPDLFVLACVYGFDGDYTIIICQMLQK